MSVLNFSVGDRVIVLPSHITRNDLWDLEGEVVSVDSVAGTVYIVTSSHNISGYPKDFVWNFHADRIEQRLVVIQHNAQASTPASGRKEIACRACGRANDLGVKVCWLCGNNP